MTALVAVDVKGSSHEPILCCDGFLEAESHRPCRPILLPHPSRTPDNPPTSSPTGRPPACRRPTGSPLKRSASRLGSARVRRLQVVRRSIMPALNVPDIDVPTPDSILHPSTRRPPARAVGRPRRRTTPAPPLRTSPRSQRQPSAPCFVCRARLLCRRVRATRAVREWA